MLFSWWFSLCEPPKTEVHWLIDSVGLLDSSDPVIDEGPMKPYHQLMASGRRELFPLGLWLLVSCVFISQWPHIHEYMGNSNPTEVGYGHGAWNTKLGGTYVDWCPRESLGQGSERWLWWKYIWMDSSKVGEVFLKRKDWWVYARQLKGEKLTRCLGWQIRQHASGQVNCLFVAS